MMWIVRLFAFVGFAVIRLAAVLLGFIMVPLALGMERLFGRWPRPLWLWRDDEGIPGWYVHVYAPGHWIASRFPRFWWYAARNPACNMKYLFSEPESFEHRGWPGGMSASVARREGRKLLWRVRWAGPFTEVFAYYIWSDTRYARLRLGWKIGSPVPGMGFTFSPNPWRKGCPTT